MWSQNYNPTGSAIVSTLLAAVPVFILLGGLGFFHIPAHIAAVAGMISALVIAMFIFDMPSAMAGTAALFGGTFGLVGIVWIIVNLMFLYRMTVKSGLFEVLQDSIAGITNDKRLQLLLIAFCFGAFFEGAALRPLPPGESKSKDQRYLDIREDDELDEKLVASWIKQASKLPGWMA